MDKEAFFHREEEGCEEGEEGGLGAGVGFEEDIIDHTELNKTTSSCSETTEPCDGLNESSEEEDELYIIKTINDVEYQINIEDNTVIRLHDFKIIGEWKSNTEEIQFNEK